MRPETLNEIVHDLANSDTNTTELRILKALWAMDGNLGRDLARLLTAAVGQAGSEELALFLARCLDPDAVAKTQKPNAPKTPVFQRVEYQRPNGEIYYSRKWGSYEDVAVLRTARDENQSILMLGEPGTGKTALAEGAYGEELITFVGNGDSRVEHLVGGFVPTAEGGWMWVPGPLQIAVEEGRPILIDEIMLLEPKVLSVIYPLLDGRGFLQISDNPSLDIVHAKEGFYIIAASNPNAPGARASEALLSRFPVHVEVTTDWDLAEALGAPNWLVSTASAMSAQRSAANTRVAWAPQFRELMAYLKVEKIWGKDFALGVLVRLCPKGDREQFKQALNKVATPAKPIKAAQI